MKPWTYHPSPVIHQSITEQLTVFPRERDMSFAAMRILSTFLLRLFLRVYFRLRITGRELLPRSGSYVLVANHSSHLDAVTLAAVLPLRSIQRAFAAAARDYFFSSMGRSVFAVVTANAVPFDRETNPRASLELCADVLNVSDQVLIMFPEGTRSTDGELHPFKAGIGLLVAGTQRQVVPAYIAGAYEAWPKGARLPRPHGVRVWVGEPLQFEQILRTKDGFHQVAAEVEAAVRRLQQQSRETR